MTVSPTERARRSADAMWASDRASKWAGFDRVSVAPGTAELALDVVPHHCNGHGICHGGVIFMLADSAFAFACNSYNEIVVAQHCTISFVAPGKSGDRLSATAAEISRTGRSGIYDVTVRNAKGATIAVFRGSSRVIDGRHFDED